MYAHVSIKMCVHIQETVGALRAAGYERAAVIGELLGLEEEDGGEGQGQQRSLIELVTGAQA